MGQLHKLWTEQKSKSKEALKTVNFKSDLGDALDHLEKVAGDLGDLQKKVKAMEPKVIEATKAVKEIFKEYKDRLEVAKVANQGDKNVLKQLDGLLHKIELMGQAAQNGYQPVCLEIETKVNTIRNRLCNLYVS